MIAIGIVVALCILALGLSTADAKQPKENPGQRAGPEGFPTKPDVVPASEFGKDTGDVIDLAPGEPLDEKHQALITWEGQTVSVMLTRDVSRFPQQARDWVAAHHPGATISFVPSGREFHARRQTTP